MRIKFIILTSALACLVSCVPVQKLKYFNDIEVLQEPIVNPQKQRIIMPYDNLYIRVFSIDEKTNQLFNSSTSMPATSSSSLSGYLVDESGNVNFPYVGNLNVSGLTTMEAGKKLEQALSNKVSNAAVSIRFLENNVTVMGQVQRQGIYPFTQDKLNIYEALALGGGISQYGNRKNVILIRQEGDKIIHHRLDLSNSQIAGKDFYYIQANDVIVVEPLKFSSWFTFNSSTFTTVVSSLSAILAIYVLVLR